jgi:hydroxymethylbilane synthase
MRPDLLIESVRGNLDTRLRKLDEGQYDAIVLAAAGLKRLGWGGRIAQILDPDVMCSAVGQGALAIETRAEGAGLNASATLDDAVTHAAVTAERGFLAALGGGCQVPIGAHATVREGSLHLLGVVIAPDGSDFVRDEASGRADQAEAIGRRLGEKLLAQGAARILAAQTADLPAAP